MLVHRAGLVGLVWELTAGILIVPGASQEASQPSAPALGWLGVPEPTEVAPPVWAAMGLPDTSQVLTSALKPDLRQLTSFYQSQQPAPVPLPFTGLACHNPLRLQHQCGLRLGFETPVRC